MGSSGTCSGACRRVQGGTDASWPPAAARPSSSFAPAHVAGKLEEIARQLRAGRPDLEALSRDLTEVSRWFYERVQPPCTCGHWVGTPENGSWSPALRQAQRGASDCRRHGLGAASISAGGAVATWSFNFEDLDNSLAENGGHT